MTIKPEEIGQAYDQITHLWESKQFNRKNGIDQHKRALAFVKTRDKALDVGCGCSGRFIDLLSAEGFQLQGVDVSKNMIALAKKRNPDVTFYHADVCQWDVPEKYDFITAWDSIWHVPLREQKPLLTKLIKSLNRDGVFIFSCGGVDEPGGHTDDYMGPEVYYSSLGINGFLQVIIEAGGVVRHFEFDQHPEMHSYFIVQKLSDE